jgi:ATP-independent RNA helicase DbpA
VHRIGRTGRAGQQGLALSLYQPNEAQRVNFIEEYQQAPIPQGDLAGIGRDIGRSRRRW